MRYRFLRSAKCVGCLCKLSVSRICTDGNHIHIGAQYHSLRVQPVMHWIIYQCAGYLLTQNVLLLSFVYKILFSAFTVVCDVMSQLYCWRLKSWIFIYIWCLQHFIQQLFDNAMWIGAEHVYFQYHSGMFSMSGCM